MALFPGGGVRPFDSSKRFHPKTLETNSTVVVLVHTGGWTCQASSASGKEQRCETTVAPYGLQQYVWELLFPAFIRLASSKRKKKQKRKRDLCLRQSGKGFSKELDEVSRTSVNENSGIITPL